MVSMALAERAWCVVTAEAAVVPGVGGDLQRTWRNGDRIDVELPMQLHLEPLPSEPDIAALMYGPIVLAGRFGAQGLSRGADLIVNERQSGEMLHIPRELPTWKLNRGKLDDQIKSRGESALAFTTRGIAGFDELQVIPYYAIAHERYNLYWRLV